MKEMQRCTSAYFVTLSYDTDHVPISKAGFMSLSSKGAIPAVPKIKGKRTPTLLDSGHLQKWFKEIRKDNPNMKYYACGEYGGKTFRPHYHVMLYNVELDTLTNIVKNVVLQNKELYLNGQYHHHCPTWKHGHITIGTFNEKTVRYTLKYCSKPKKIPMFQRDDRIPEYALMSKNLGSNYLTEEMKKWHKADLLNRMYIPLQDDKLIALPRYYKEKIYTDKQRKRIGWNAAVKDMNNKTYEERKKETRDKYNYKRRFEKSQRKETL